MLQGFSFNVTESENESGLLGLVFALLFFLFLLFQPFFFQRFCWLFFYALFNVLSF